MAGRGGDLDSESQAGSVGSFEHPEPNIGPFTARLVIMFGVRTSIKGPLLMPRPLS